MPDKIITSFKYLLFPIFLTASAGDIVQADELSSRLDYTVGIMRGELENQLGGLVSQNLVNQPYFVNSNRRQFDFSSNMMVSQLRLQASRAKMQYSIALWGVLSSKETVATDSLWPTPDTREYYAESSSKADFIQWDASISKAMKHGRLGVGIKNRELSFYNHDGLESYTSVPGYVVKQNGSIVDYNISYLIPYFSYKIAKSLSPDMRIELQGEYSPIVKASETDINYWYDYRAESELSGSSLEFSAAATWQLTKDSEFLFRYDYLTMGLSGTKDYENRQWLPVDQDHNVKQSRLMLGVSVAL